MALGLADILDAACSHAQASGWFDAGVTGHEPKNAPGNGLSAALWVDRVRPVPARSGLASTTAVVELNVRISTTMLHEPADEVDPLIMSAADALMGAYSGDFELGGLAQIDLLGAYGTPLAGRAGYLNQDGRLYRIFLITLPLVVNDLWSQTA
jgi:hypothetical protein